MSEIITRYISPENQQWLDEVYEKLSRKMEAEAVRVGNKIPYTPRKDGFYQDEAEEGYGISFWTNGFYPGMLWQMYQATDNEMYKQYAIEIEDRLASLLEEFEVTDHDIGFLFLPTSVANYRKTNDEKARIRGLRAAQILAGRYNPVGQFIRAWNDSEMMEKRMGGKASISGWMIIDCLMNVPLLYWASEQTKDPRFRQIAINHVKTAQRHIVREDGSCNHVAVFDPETGEFIHGPAGQGYAEGSSWSRGQSWAVYGFALSYRHTGDKSFLETAKKTAHYVISNMAVENWLPLVDYRAPEQPVKYDSTAAMITACGLLELAEHVDEHERKLYIRAAIEMLKAVEKKFANWDENKDSIIDGGTFFYHDPDGSNTEQPIIYADYYFIEAINRLKNQELFIW